MSWRLAPPLPSRAAPIDASPSPAVWFLFFSGAVFAIAGAITVLVGRALVGRRPIGRSAALALALPSLVVIPFGTALAVYTFWTLLNDDARRAFGENRATSQAKLLLTSLILLCTPDRIVR